MTKCLLRNSFNPWWQKFCPLKFFDIVWQTFLCHKVFWQLVIKNIYITNFCNLLKEILCHNVFWHSVTKILKMQVFETTWQRFLCHTIHLQFVTKNVSHSFQHLLTQTFSSQSSWPLWQMFASQRLLMLCDTFHVTEFRDTPWQSICVTLFSSPCDKIFASQNFSFWFTKSYW